MLHVQPFKKEVTFVDDRNTLTEGPIGKKLILFALPVLFGNILQQFYNTFDSWCVGNFIGGKRRNNYTVFKE